MYGSEQTKILSKVSISSPAIRQIKMRAKISLQEVGGVARLQVRVADAEVVAFLSEATWRSRRGPADSEASFGEWLLANQTIVESAVARKAASMSRTEVILRPDDLT